LRNVAEDVVIAPVGFSFSIVSRVFHKVFHRVVENLVENSEISAPRGD